MKILNLFTLLVSVLFLTGCTQVDTLSSASQMPDITSGESPLLDTLVREFEINAYNYKYSITNIKVRKGQTVKIILTNS